MNARWENCFGENHLREQQKKFIHINIFNEFEFLCEKGKDEKHLAARAR